MAALAAQRSQQRKPQAVYGKARRNVTHHADFFDDDEDELALPAPKPATRRIHTTPATTTTKITNATMATNAKNTEMKTATSATAYENVPEPAPKVNETYSVTKSVSQPKKKGGLPMKTRAPVKEVDTFDVPSSGDEKESAVTFMPVAPKRRARNGLVEDRQEEHVQLPPWERKATRGKASTRSTTMAVESQERSAGSQLQEEFAQAKPAELSPLQRGKKSASNVKADAKKTTKEDKPEASPPSLTGLSATERLARLRAKQTSSPSIGEQLSPPTTNTAKRAEAASEVTKQPQSKRRRTTPQPKKVTSDVEMGGTDAAKVTDSVSPESTAAQQESDIFDVPAEDTVQQPTRTTARPAATRPRNANSRIQPRYSRRTGTQQSMSAPEELTRMLPPDTDIDLPDAGELPSTPPIMTSAEHSSTPTPKQTRAWANFFEPAVATPSADLAKLDISDKRRAAQHAGATRPKAPVRSSSDVPKRRVRMVDRLRAEAVSSSEDGRSDEEDDDHENDMMIDDKATANSTTITKAEIRSQKLDDPIPPLSQSQSYSQTQDKPLALPEPSTSKVTYAKQRSYLVEENLEADILLDAPLSTPQRAPSAARRTTKPSTGQGSKPSKPSKPASAFDLDGDDDAPAGGLRSIHELRAGGRNTRLLGEISALLTEISDHTPSARSRRRGALLELATQLLDPTFATESFVGHGFEQHLLAEVSATAGSSDKDSVGDFLLVSAVMLLLSGDVPAHTAGTFGMALPWLVSLLRTTTPVAKAVKDRKANLSRSMQGDVVAFAGKFAELQTIWGTNEDEKLGEVSTRLVSLSTLDLLIGRLRGAGDSSELLDPSSLTMLLPQTPTCAFVPKEVESRLGVSVLEALSTLSATSLWPAEVVRAVAGLPAAFSGLSAKESGESIGLDKTTAHAKWLAYRLSLNLTNDADLDFALFVEQGAVEALLKDVVDGFAGIKHPSTSTAAEAADKDAPTAPQADDADALPLDLLVLALGTLINLFEHSGLARRAAIASETGLPLLESAVQTFKSGREKVAQAQSEQESAWNVAYGYLAVLLAGVCADADGRLAVDELLSAPVKPDQDQEQDQGAGGEDGKGEQEEGGLQVLVQAVRDFVTFHQKVDGMQAQMQAQAQLQAQAQAQGLGGEMSEVGDVSVASVGGAGAGVWSAFTERLVAVLGRLERGV